MPVTTCPHCGTRLNAPDAVLGHEVVCGRCRRNFTAKAEPEWPSFGQPAGPSEPGAPSSPSSPARTGQAEGAGAPAVAPEAPGPAPSEGPAQAAGADGGPRFVSLPAAAAPPSPPGPPPSFAPPPPIQTPYVSPPPTPMGYAQPMRTSGRAVASLILGISSIVFCWCSVIPPLVCSILAVVFYPGAMRDVDTGTVLASSAGMAKTGRICGIVGIFLNVGFWLFVILIAAVHG